MFSTVPNLIVDLKEAMNKHQLAVYRRKFERVNLVWDADTIRKALDECRDSKLYVAMNLSFACSLRIGEILGLTWDNIHISDEDIATDNAHLFVERELQRAFLKAIRALGMKKTFSSCSRPLSPTQPRGLS